MKDSLCLLHAERSYTGMKTITCSGPCREFVKSFLPLFAEDNKQIEVQAELNRGRHPCLRGVYRKCCA